MSYKVEYSKTAQKQIKIMDRYTQVMIMRWITKILLIVLSYEYMEKP